ncbi:histidine phosphatase family protein [Gordonia sp. X0973]|uniref:histidine phosphatase family protein n=1 Tax=Gordonia sp. X0973 TaxID=2742602 RepID=UPI000F52E4AD|nr:histidine phosphatase family protein [Gordonia sp. X0973]QKT08772.1 histidine phosphatase family protein [Gordonia sp. X0973]
MGAIYLVRHGQALASAYGVSDHGESDPTGGLTPTGQMQARVTGAVLRGLVPSFTTAISGGLARQRETLAGVLGEFDELPEAVVDDSWDEYDLAGLMGAPTAAQLADGRSFQQSLDGVLAAWIRGELESPEPFEEYALRVARAGERAVAEAGSGKNVLVVSSAGSITLWLAQHLGIDAAHWPRLSASMMNASITKALVGRSGVTVLSMNEHLHLSDRDGGIATFR